MTIREMCRKDDYPEDGINQIDTSISENLINALSKLTANQEAMEKRLQSMDSMMKESNASSPSSSQTQLQTEVSNVQQQNSFPRVPNFAQYRNLNRFQYRPPMPRPSVFHSNNMNFGYPQAFNQAQHFGWRGA